VELAEAIADLGGNYALITMKDFLVNGGAFAARRLRVIYVAFTTDLLQIFYLGYNLVSKLSCFCWRRIATNRTRCLTDPGNPIGSPLHPIFYRLCIPDRLSASSGLLPTLYTRSAIRFIRSSADFVYPIGYPLHPVFCLSNPIG
jgi:hypothetical protein